jgi:hypothetical protein
MCVTRASSLFPFTYTVTMKDGGLACSLVHSACHPSSGLEHDVAALRRQNASTTAEEPRMVLTQKNRRTIGKREIAWRRGQCLFSRLTISSISVASLHGPHQRRIPTIQRRRSTVNGTPSNQRMNAFPMMAPFRLVRLTLGSRYLSVRPQLLQKTGQIFGMLFLLRKDPLQ